MPHSLRRHILPALLLSAVLLPVGVSFVFLFARLFAWFGRPVSSMVLDGVGLGLGLLWLVVLVALLLSVACLEMLAGADQSDGPEQISERGGHEE